MFQPTVYVCCLGNFACGFEDTAAVFPGLQIEGFGILPLPLPPDQATTLKNICRPAPYGRGEETLWDPAVRSTWQLDPATFLTFHNPGTASSAALCV